jgi:hypothetical protein
VSDRHVVCRCRCRCSTMFVDVVGWMHRAGMQSWKTGFL